MINQLEYHCQAPCYYVVTVANYLIKASHDMLMINLSLISEKTENWLSFPSSGLI